MSQIQYKGFTIQEDFRNPYSSKPEFMFYPTAEGVQHDADCDQDGYRYCGNCKWASSIEEAKDEISEIVMMNRPVYQVETIIKLGSFRLRNIAKLDWIVDAIMFVGKTNGRPLNFEIPQSI